MTIDLESAGSGYGSLAGVQDFLRPTLVLTTTTPVTTSDATEELVSIAAAMNVRLEAAGYVTPVTASAALLILDGCANRLVAADVLERLIISRDPSKTRVEVAEVWRKQANDLLALIYSGDAVLPDATRNSTGVADIPSVSSQTSKFPHANSEDFVDAYGSIFSGASNG